MQAEIHPVMKDLKIFESEPISNQSQPYISLKYLQYHKAFLHIAV